MRRWAEIRESFGGASGFLQLEQGGLQLDGSGGDNALTRGNDQSDRLVVKGGMIRVEQIGARGTGSFSQSVGWGPDDRGTAGATGDIDPCIW